jgi:hypothetical protein
MKKSTAYTRKRQHKVVSLTHNVGVMQRTVGQSGSFEEHHREQGAKLLEVLNRCFLDLKSGCVSPESYISHDELMTAISTARIRAEHVAGTNDNPAWAICSEAIEALNRAAVRKTEGLPWSLTPRDELYLEDAIEAYRVILMASSPLQMQLAWEEHNENLKAELTALKRHTG